jgi:hypothetical protein
MAIWYDPLIMIKPWFLDRRKKRRGENEQRNTIAMSYTTFLDYQKVFCLPFQ